MLLAVLAGTLLLATIPPGLLVLGRLDRARAAKQFREEFDRAVRVAPFLRDSSAPDRADALEAWKSRVHASGIPLGDMGLSSDDVEAWIASAKSRRAELALDAVIGRLPALEGDLKGIRAEIDRLAEYRAVESRDREIARLRKSVDEVRGKIPRGTESDARVARVLQLASELTVQADLAARLAVAPMTAEEIERMRQAERYVRDRVQRALYRGVAISFSDVDLMVRGNRFVVSGSFEVHVTGDTWTSASWFVVTFEGDRVSIDGDSSWAK